MMAMRHIPVGSAGNRLPLIIADDTATAAAWVADQMSDLISQRAKAGVTLGLPTGSTPLAVYAALVDAHRRQGLSLRWVRSFNLDEYHGLAADHPDSYRSFMDQHLFAHVDCPQSSWQVPRGDVPATDVPALATAYEQAITAAGGLDLCLLGIGRNGHIAFNEPGSSPVSRTRLVWLDAVTRRDAASGFGGLDRVPRAGVTMGVATIMAARRIILLASGPAKSAALAAAVEGPVDGHCPASWLQDHPDVVVVCDRAAAAELTAMRAPWLAEPVTWDADLVRRAVISCAVSCAKPILALGEDDHHSQGLHQLVAERGGVQDINLDVFRDLQAVITGWPGGKPPQFRRPGDIVRSRDAVHPKRILVFSPHPDDDVIGMGGVILRLIDHGHEVMVVHMTNGVTAVDNEEVRRLVDAAGCDHATPISDLKARIRQAEARSAARACGLSDVQVRFLDLPFYHRPGRVIDEADVAAVADLLEEVQPHQLYAAGDLCDPNDTHRRCLTVISRAVALGRGAAWLKDCECFLYRGAWDTWAAHELDMAVPLAPADIERKRRAILAHRSQADGALFPGDDRREFWQRAEDRCGDLARILDRLGLAEYAAIEGFARFHPEDINV